MESTFAQLAFDHDFAKDAFEGKLCELGVVFERIGWDHYDVSLEIYEVANDCRLSEEAQRFISDAGFMKVYVNHLDGWETHYTWGREFSVQRGWRRRWVPDQAVETSRGIGHHDPGYFEISEWPEGWKGQEKWLDSGYMRVVPDPLPSPAGE